MAYADRIPGSRRLTTIAGVAAIHGLIGYVFVSGMAVEFVRGVVRPLTTTNIPADIPPPPDTSPPPGEHTLPHRTTSSSSASTTTLQQPTDMTWTLPTLPPGPTLTFPDTIPAQPDVLPPPPVSRASGAQARGDRAGWITTGDYPAASIRAGEEGSVGLLVRIGTDGRVTSCIVTASSGHATLDQATCRLYQRRARFTPARDDAGAATTAEIADRVRWRLPM